MKILFIIMSHIPEQIDNPEYRDVEFFNQLENIMRNFYKSIPEIHYIFVKCDKYLENQNGEENGIPYKLDWLNNTLYVKGEENISSGICKKVIVSLKLFIRRPYDFIFKTTLNCIPNIHFIKNIMDYPIDYAGPKITNTDTEKDFIGGYAILLSKKAIRILIANWDKCINIHDDEKIGCILTNKDICKKYFDALSMSELTVHNYFSDTIITIKNCIYKDTKNKEEHLTVQKLYIEEAKLKYKNNMKIHNYINTKFPEKIQLITASEDITKYHLEKMGIPSLFTTDCSKNIFTGSEAKSIIQLGFGTGHSTLLILLSNSTCNIHCFINSFYSCNKDNFLYLNSVFPTRLKYYEGRYSNILTIYKEPLADLLYINDTITNEIFFKSVEKLEKNSLIIINNNHINSIKMLWTRLIDSGIIKEVEISTPDSTHSIGRYINKFI